jgi:hypothetical protein
MNIRFAAALIILLSSPTVFAQNPASQIPSGAKVFIAPMPNRFDSYLKAAIEKKKVPIMLVADKSSAQFEITGASESQKAGAAKIILMGDWHSTEDASVQVANLATGEVVFAYSVHEQSSKHLKERIGK